VDWYEVGGSEVDSITQYKAGLKFAMSNACAISLGYEEVTWDPTPGGPPDGGKEKYVTFGIDHSIGANASMRLFYQLIEEQWPDYEYLYKSRGTIGGIQVKGQF